MSDSGDTEAQTSSTANLAEGDAKPGSKKKIIRLLTVMAYVSSVSGTAFMLSMYYLFLWEPKVAEHHLKADPMGHQALALKGHVDHGQRGLYDPLYDGYPLPPGVPGVPGGVPGMYRPPGTADSRGMYPPLVASSPSGGYRSAAPPMGPPMGTPGRPATRYDYQYQDPLWVHSAYAPQPPRPPSLSQMRDPGDSLFMARLTTLARAVRAHPSTPSSAPPPATAPSSESTSTAAPANATEQTAVSETTTPSTAADAPPTSPAVLVATPEAQPSAPPSSTAAPRPPTTKLPKSRRAPNLTAQRQPPAPSISLLPRKAVHAKKTPPMLTLGAVPRPPGLPAGPLGTTPSPSAATSRTPSSPSSRPVPTALLLSTARTLAAAVQDDAGAPSV